MWNYEEIADASLRTGTMSCGTFCMDAAKAVQYNGSIFNNSDEPLLPLRLSATSASHSVESVVIIEQSSLEVQLKIFGLDDR